MARTPTTADAFNAIAEASRRDLLSAIGTDEVTVNELVSRTRMSQPRVQALERASCRRSGAGALTWATSLLPRQWRSATPRPRLGRRVRTRLERTPRPARHAAHRTQGGEIMSTRHGSATVVLPSDTTILITRSFDAPAALIFRALTEPELVTRWWGSEDAQWEVCEIDLRVGGTWRYVVRQPCESGAGQGGRVSWRISRARSAASAGQHRGVRRSSGGRGCRFHHPG